MVKKVLITGKNGQVSSALRTFSTPKFNLIYVGRPELDLANPYNIDEIITRIKPDYIINAAAYTFVDKAEDEPELAMQINGLAASEIAKAAQKLSAPLIHISTDYVFDGTKNSPYTEEDSVNPISIYGKSKLYGEHEVQKNTPQHIILRTSWVYSPFGSNFVKTMLKYGSERDVLKIVDDQHGNPTSALEIVEALFHIIEQLESGNHSSLGKIFHFSGKDEVTWYGFAQEMFKQSHRLGGANPRLEAIPTHQFPTKAVRPKNSRLNCQKFELQFNYQRDSLESCINKVLKYLFSHRSH
jgi:dTDP-4-dehydrorhamnose reductase